ncbi:glycosyltransferase family 9 protein [Selenomonas sp. TAMA-11512]|uniref:glycosyltransferase family 9 protein n=1 Tax=Selenomonas sp. TAMA-11512 TaxID=3095337 RepID=UPI0030CF35D2
MHIGDLMLVTPVLRTLRSNYPKARLTLLADRKLGDLVAYNPHIDDCILLDKKGEDNHPLSFLHFVQKVRKHHFDLAVNLHRNERASALAAFSGASKIVGYSKPLFSFFFDRVLPNKKAVMHQIHSHFEVLEKTGLIDHIDDGGLEMELPPGAMERAKRIFAEHFPAGKKVIALNIGASWRTKRWLDGYFAEVADHFLRRDYGIAFFGGPMDTALVEACIEKMEEKASPHLHVFTGKLSLGELAGMLKQCVLFITTDSGPMHVGVAMRVPIVTMFGASPVPGFYPYDERDVLIKTPVGCHPCGKHDCPLPGEENMKCMKTMPPEVIIKYAEELLAKYETEAGHLPRAESYVCRVIDLQKEEG